jgi:hypothetical protein
MEPEQHRQAAHAARSLVDRVAYMLQRLDEVRSYLQRSARSLVNDNIARIAGEQVSTADVESTVNELVNWRMGKKQQMRWSPTSAQLHLRVRAADLNGRLPDYVAAEFRSGEADRCHHHAVNAHPSLNGLSSFCPSVEEDADIMS